MLTGKKLFSYHEVLFAQLENSLSGMCRTNVEVFVSGGDEPGGLAHDFLTLCNGVTYRRSRDGGWK